MTVRPSLTMRPSAHVDLTVFNFQSPRKASDANAPGMSAMAATMIVAKRMIVLLSAGPHESRRTVLNISKRRNDVSKVPYGPHSHVSPLAGRVLRRLDLLAPLLPRMLTKPRTVCFCQPVVATISASVPPFALHYCDHLRFLVGALGIRL